MIVYIVRHVLPRSYHVTYTHRNRSMIVMCHILPEIYTVSSRILLMAYNRDLVMIYNRTQPR